jgi:hypothetical protein
MYGVYLQYSLKKLGIALDGLKEEEEIMQLLTAAVGFHIRGDPLRDVSRGERRQKEAHCHQCLAN